MIRLNFVIEMKFRPNEWIIRETELLVKFLCTFYEMFRNSIFFFWISKNLPGSKEYF